MASERHSARARRVCVLTNLLPWCTRAALACFVGLVLYINLRPHTWPFASRMFDFEFDPRTPPVALSSTAANSPGILYVTWDFIRDEGFFVPHETVWYLIDAPLISGGSMSGPDLDLLRPFIAERVRAQHLGRLDDRGLDTKGLPDVSEQLALALIDGTTSKAQITVRSTAGGVPRPGAAAVSMTMSRIYWPWLGWNIAKFALMAGLVACGLFAFFARSLQAYFRSGLRALERHRCPHCGYSLAGSVAARCPECGTTIEEWRREARHALALDRARDA